MLYVYIMIVDLFNNSPDLTIAFYECIFTSDRCPACEGIVVEPLIFIIGFNA